MELAIAVAGENAVLHGKGQRVMGPTRRDLDLLRSRGQRRVRRLLFLNRRRVLPLRLNFLRISAAALLPAAPPARRSRLRRSRFRQRLAGSRFCRRLLQPVARQGQRCHLQREDRRQCQAKQPNM